MFTDNHPIVLVRGGGDLASGVILRLHRAGFPVIVLELDKPLAVRRSVSFAEAVYEGEHIIEGVVARSVSPDQLYFTLELGEVPVVVDPNANILVNAFITSPQNTIVVDARLLKQEPDLLPVKPYLYIGLGPGFVAGANCDAVVETLRGHTMGRVYWDGSTEADSGQPDGDPKRVLRAPVNGVIATRANIGDPLKEGQEIAVVNGKSAIVSPLKGVLRGIVHDGVTVFKGMKIGDVDPRDDPGLCNLVSDKALAVGGGVLEAVLVRLKGKALSWQK